MKQLRKEVIECLDNNDETNIILALDIVYCTAFNITTTELDHLVEHMSENDIKSWSEILTGNPTFMEKKRLLKFRNKHLNYFYNG